MYIQDKPRFTFTVNNFICHDASQNTTTRLPATSHWITTDHLLHVFRNKFVCYEWYKPRVVYRRIAAPSSHTDSEMAQSLEDSVYLGLILRSDWLLWSAMWTCVWKSKFSWNPLILQVL